MPTVRKTNVLLTRDYTWKFKGRISEDSATSVLRYKDDFDDWQTRCPIYGTVHPDLPGFTLTEIEADREPGDQIAVTLTYEVNSFTTEYPGKPGAEEPTPRYSVSINEGEEHILTSDFAEDLTEEQQDALMAIANGATDVQYPGSDDAGISLMAKIKKGNVSIITTTLVYTERKLSTTLDDLKRINLNHREVPPGPIGGGADYWLYIGGTADPSETGDTWTITRNWKFSPSGWDTDLYPAAT